jgi:hypothetical protein
MVEKCSPATSSRLADPGPQWAVAPGYDVTFYITMWNDKKLI